MEVAVIVVAAGTGSRAGAGLPKQYRLVSGQPVLRHSLKLFTDHPAISAGQPVIAADHDALFSGAAAELPRCLPPVNGGDTRQQSVFAGLKALAKHKPHAVLVHDAARAFAPRTLIDSALLSLKSKKAAIPVLAVTDTIKRVDGSGNVLGTVDRGELRAVQTPQAFAYDTLLAAHEKAARENLHDFTDDAAIMEWFGQAVSVFPGSAENIKLTTESDFDRLAIAEFARLGDVRTGTGYDVHAFTEGNAVTLGGVRIPHDRKLDGHSDADVLLHAITDAILGAIADGDIGAHFPPSDQRWRGAESRVFLTFACERVRARGGMIAHIDATLICEAPKIGPHRDAMRAKIAEVCRIDPGRVGVQATTNEKLGFIGRGEGIAGMATATIRLPWTGA